MLRNVSVAPIITRLRQAILDQHAIGWTYAVRGYLCTQWLLAQQAEHPKSTLIGIRQQWLKPVIREIWVANMSLWESRNKSLHSTGNPLGASVRDSTIDAQIRTLYSVQDTFAQADRQLFDVPLDTRLSHGRRVKRDWLSLVSRYHPTTRQRQQGNQPLLTQYFDPPIYPDLCTQ